MKIAIFGGSFDPFHKGHQKIIDETLLSFDIDILFVVPTYLNPFKNSSHSTAQNRLDFLKSTKQNKKVQILDFEVNQHTSVPTIDTVHYLKNKYELSKIYLIIGADNLNTLDKWHKIDELYNLVEIIVATRDNIDIVGYRSLNIDMNISSTKLRVTNS